MAIRGIKSPGVHGLQSHFQPHPLPTCPRGRHTCQRMSTCTGSIPNACSILAIIYWYLLKCTIAVNMVAAQACFAAPSNGNSNLHARKGEGWHSTRVKSRQALKCMTFASIGVHTAQMATLPHRPVCSICSCMSCHELSDSGDMKCLLQSR